MCSVLHIILPCCAQLCTSHMHHASFYSPCLFSILRLSHAPCLLSLSLPLLRSLSHTCPLSRLTLFRPLPFCFSHTHHASLRPSPSAPCFELMPNASLHSTTLSSALNPTHAPCLTSPSSAALLPAPHKCPVPPFTLPAYASLPISHSRPLSLHPACLYSALRPTRAPCLTSLSLPLLRFASYAALVSRLTRLASSAPCH